MPGCDSAGPGGSSESREHAEAASGSAASDEILTRLAQADAADGTADKVIRKCVTCSLYMDGDAAHVATAHGYEVHLCSESCLDRFQHAVLGPGHCPQPSSYAIDRLVVPGADLDLRCP